jgi:EAL domain-containing protein (putative c-di-GMP-specific phosphodiesterase class I)
MQVPDVLKPFMADMREHGIVFALDDFGAGMTSLRLLQDLGFEIAKIDGSLVKNVDRAAAGPDRLAGPPSRWREELGMYLVAEAVETEAEATWLREAGVGCLQGYLFGAPTVTPDFRPFRHGTGAQGPGDRLNVPPGSPMAAGRPAQICPRAGSCLHLQQVDLTA